jgi:hypothetical protein
MVATRLGMMHDAKQKHICFNCNAVISCLQHFFVEIINVIAPADVDFLICFKLQLATNLERVALNDCEPDANEAHVNHSTSSSSKMACFVFNAFLSKSSMLSHQWMLIF